MLDHSVSKSAKPPLSSSLINITSPKKGGKGCVGCLFVFFVILLAAGFMSGGEQRTKIIENLDNFFKKITRDPTLVQKSDAPQIPQEASQVLAPITETLVIPSLETPVEPTLNETQPTPVVTETKQDKPKPKTKTAKEKKNKQARTTPKKS